MAGKLMHAIGKFTAIIMPFQAPVAAAWSNPQFWPSIIAAVVGVGIVDIASYMRRIIPTAVVVGIIIVDRRRPYRQVNSCAAAATLDMNHMIPGAFVGLERGLPARFGMGHWRNAKETDRQQASRQNGCE